MDDQFSGRKKFTPICAVARTTDPHTSHEAVNKSDSRVRISDAIERLSKEAGYVGITINECAARMPEHKAWSISPMFAPLVRKGLLLRRVIGLSKPCNRWPKGKEIFETRADLETKKRCIVHYHQAFAAKRPAESERNPKLSDAITKQSLEGALR